MRFATSGIQFVSWALILQAAFAASTRVSAGEVRYAQRLPSFVYCSDAADKAGADFWDDEYDNETTCHVMVQLDRSHAVVRLGLPRGTRLSKLDPWLRQLAKDLGWTGSDLVIYPRRRDLFAEVTAPSPERVSFLTKSRTTLDLGRIRKEVQDLTDLPVVTCLICNGNFSAASSSPDANAQETEAAFLFYGEGKPPGAITVTYGVTARWFAALWSTVLLVLLFPIAAALFFRHSHAGITAAELAIVMPKWRLRMLIIGSAAGLAAVVGLSLSPQDYYSAGNFSGGAAGMVPVLTAFWCRFAFEHALLWMRRSTSPDDPVPGAKRSSTSLVWSAVVFSAMAVVVLRFFGFVTSSSALAILVGFGAALAAGLALTIAVVRAKRAGKQKAPAATTRLSDGAEIRRRVLECAARDEEEAAKRKVVVSSADPQYKPLLEGIERAYQRWDAEQRAAVDLSSEFAQQAGFPRWTDWVGWIIAVLAATLAGLGASLLMVPEAMVSRVFIWMIETAVPFVLLWATMRRAMQKLRHGPEARADLSVATALEKPERYLEALRDLEIVAAEHAASPLGRTYLAAVSERRRRLEQALRIRNEELTCE